MDVQLSAERQAQLVDYAHRHGQEPAVALHALLEDALDSEFLHTQATVEALGRGLTDLEAGRTRPLAETFALLREKHGFAR